MEWRVTPDTGLLRRRNVVIACAIAALAVILPPVSTAAPEPRATVIWIRGDRAYVAMPDSSSVEPGDAATFRERDRLLASGEVISVIRGEVALVQLRSGSLERVRKMERVRVALERPPLAPRTTLRIALPSAARGNLLFRCGDVTLRSPAEPRYRVTALVPRTWRLLADSTGRASSPASSRLWPDTLLVRLFDESADEEIALERGEVDVAVFWPGELSLHVREDARWRGYPVGTRARGVLAAVGSVRPALFDSTGLAAFNEALFRGDLAPVAFHAGEREGAEPPSARGLTDVDVDPSIPGRAAIRGWLARNAGPTTGGAAPPTRLVYLDAPPDSLPTPDAAPLFAIGCPVVAASGLQRYVRALGPGVFADMAVCERQGTAR